MLPALIYYISLPFIYLVSVLPFRVLYVLSDAFYFLMYHVLGYRKKVVFDNLRNSFPDKTEQEIEKIARGFYEFLCDMFMETFKTLTISKKAMLKRSKLTDNALAIFTKFAEENKSIILVMGHLGNWEWGGNSFSLLCKQQLYVIYHPLANKKFDSLMYNMRSRFGTRLIPMKETFREMLAQKNGLSATAFISDQTPSPEKAYWTRFLNQDTPVFQGTEIIAKKINYPVVYISIDRIKRGHYTLDAEILFANPETTVNGEITEAHTRRLEKDIIAHPEIWLWSHRRWKHKKPA